MIVFQSNVIKVDKKTLTRYIGVAGIFDWEREAKPQITRNGVINIFRKEGLFMGQIYRTMEDRSWGLGWHVTWVLLKKKDLNLNLKRFSKLA